MLRYRKIKCPDIQDLVVYRARHIKTDEVLECADLVQLFKRIALTMEEEPLICSWTITKYHRLVKK